jgi:DNA-binding HxlR family transcriptional regulator
LPKRIYAAQETCPVARTLNVVGDRWTVLILRDLSWGRRRFGELCDSLQGIAPNLLSQRLKSLESDGMVETVVYCDRPPRVMYKLTEKGKAFTPVLRALKQYGEAWEPAPTAAGQGRPSG